MYKKDTGIDNMTEIVEIIPEIVGFLFNINATGAAIKGIKSDRIMESMFTTSIY